MIAYCPDCDYPLREHGEPDPLSRETPSVCDGCGWRSDLDVGRPQHDERVDQAGLPL